MIPYFRAKKINGDEYAEGCLNVWEQNEKVYYSIMEIGIYPSPFNNIHLIDQTTLAIHFPDMIDSQGNKIFASLSEDGKGGDIAKYSNQGHWIAMYIENAFMWVNVLDMQKIGTKQPVSFLRLKPLAKMIVIGIQQ